MTRPSILVTQRLPDAVEARAATLFTATLTGASQPLARPELVAAARDVDGILLCASDRFDADTIAALPQSVKLLATFSVGTDHIDLAAAARRGLIVTNTPDVLTDATADITLLLILAACRRAGEGERMVRADAWSGWTPTQLLGTHLGGRRLGILGMGRIGRAVAARARPFGLTIHYNNRTRLDSTLEQGAIFHQDPEDLLRHADILSLNAPATPETNGFLNSARIALLPPGAIVVNTARGALVDDADLIAALRSGRIAAAGLDVFNGEPRLHPDYRTLDNAFLLPHLGSATVDTRNAMGFRALENLAAGLGGGTPPDRVI